MSTDAIIFGVVIVVLLWLIYSQLKEILKALIENTETVAQWGDEITAALKPPLTDDELIDEEERKRQIRMKSGGVRRVNYDLSAFAQIIKYPRPYSVPSVSLVVGRKCRRTFCG